METLSELRDAVRDWFYASDSDHAGELMDLLDRYIDARIMVATKHPVPITSQVVCPCVWREGRFEYLCGLHESEFRRRSTWKP